MGEKAYTRRRRELSIGDGQQQVPFEVSGAGSALTWDSAQRPSLQSFWHIYPVLPVGIIRQDTIDQKLGQKHQVKVEFNIVLRDKF